MRRITLVVVLSLMGLALFSGLASANPWAVTYVGEYSYGADNEWDLQWLVAWSATNIPPETATFVWFDIPDDVPSSDITYYTDTAFSDYITASGESYYIGVASDPYGVAEGDHVFLWALSDPGTHYAFLSAGVDNLPAIYSIDEIVGGLGGTNLNPGDTYTDFSSIGLTPEPGSMAVLLFGLGAMGLIRRRKK